eukprot:COSAG01_NODE_188_length_22632_cov_15.284915_9_plen_1110_part_00
MTVNQGLTAAALIVSTAVSTAATSAAAAAAAAAAAPPLPPQAPEGVPLFSEGDMGYDSFRGTVLLQEVGRPWLIGFACGRKGGGDVSGRDLFLRRSSNGGRSWDAPKQWARVSNQSLLAGDGVYMGSAVFDTRTNTSMVFWGDCLEKCAGQHGNPRRSNETVLAAPSFMMTRSTDSFETWTTENLTALNPHFPFPVNTYGYGLQDAQGRILFCGPYGRGTAGCMRSQDGGHHFVALHNTTAREGLTWSEQQMTRLSARGPNTLMMVGHGAGTSEEQSGYLMSFSKDFGESWDQPTALPAVRQPGCQGSLLAVGDTVIISHPNNGTGYLPGNHDPARNHMTLSFIQRGWESNWKAWRHHLVFAGYSGYSAMQDLSVGSAGEAAVGLIYERGVKRFDEDVWVAVVPVKDLALFKPDDDGQRQQQGTAPADLMQHVPAAPESWKRTRCGSPSSPGIDLITTWGRACSPTSVAAAFGYPRPQMTRGNSTWVSLNGLWEFEAFTPQPGLRPPFGTRLNETILVPFPVESCLSGVHNHSSAGDDVPPTYTHVWYRTTIRASSAAVDATTTSLLHFGAVDWRAVVYVNGVWVGSHEGGYDAFTLEISDALHSGDNEVFVAVFDPSNSGSQPFGKQRDTSRYAPAGDTYSPVTGIWQSVWIESVPRRYISSLKTYADMKQLHITVETNLPDAAPVNVTVTNRDRVVLRAAGQANLPFSVSMPRGEIILWSPERPFLFNVSVTYHTDKVGSYFGMREVSLCRDANGTNRPCINGEYRFLSGVLDQSWWPDGQYTAPGDDALLWDLQAMQRLGLNMVRLHQKTNPQRYYYHADHLGMVVQQDMVQHYGDPKGNANSAGIASPKPFFSELKTMIDTVAPHPAVIQYELFNENDEVSDFNASDVVAWARWYDHTRLIDADSGGEGLAAQHAFRIGDVNDFHAGVWPPQGPTAGATPTQYAEVAEWGGISYVTAGHAYQSHSMGADGKTFNKDCDWAMIGPPLNSSQAAAAAIVDAQRYFAKNRSYSAGGYVQWTDIEAECDGILNYDRVPKFNEASSAQMRQMNSQLVGKPVACRVTPAPTFDFPRWMTPWALKTDDTPMSPAAAPAIFIAPFSFRVRGIQ